MHGEVRGILHRRAEIADFRYRAGEHVRFVHIQRHGHLVAHIEVLQVYFVHLRDDFQLVHQHQARQQLPFVHLLTGLHGERANHAVLRCRNVRGGIRGGSSRHQAEQRRTVFHLVAHLHQHFRHASLPDRRQRVTPIHNAAPDLVAGSAVLVAEEGEYLAWLKFAREHLHHVFRAGHHRYAPRADRTPFLVGAEVQRFAHVHHAVVALVVRRRDAARNHPFGFRAHGNQSAVAGGNGSCVVARGAVNCLYGRILRGVNRGCAHGEQQIARVHKVARFPGEGLECAGERRSNINVIHRIHNAAGHGAVRERSRVSQCDRPDHRQRKQESKQLFHSRNHPFVDSLVIRRSLAPPPCQSTEPCASAATESGTRTHR